MMENEVILEVARIDTAGDERGATGSLVDQHSGPSPPESDSNGGTPFNLSKINHAAVDQNSLVASQGSGTTAEPSSASVADFSPIGSPTEVTELSSHVEDDREEEFRHTPNLETTSQPIVLHTHESRVNSLPSVPDLRLELRDGSDPIIKEVLEEIDLIDDTPRSRNDGNIDNEIDRAARTGHGLPEDATLDRKPKLHYEPSEKSNITDLGARGRKIAYEKGRQRPGPWSEEEMKRPIQDRLLEALQKVPGHKEKKGFFAEEQLDVLVNERCVTQELELCFKGTLDSGTIKKSAQKICGTDGHLDPIATVKFKKIFVLLVLSEKTTAILPFLDEGVADRDLPLSKVPYRKKKPCNIFGLARKTEPGVAPKALACFRDWTHLAVMRFEEWQWTTLAPFFHRGERKNVKHYPLEDQIPLPFTVDSRDDEAESVQQRLEFNGGFSNVFKVGIHPEHHEFDTPNITSQYFAVKCLLSKDRKEFKREVDTLMKFSDDAHPHLVSLLATYEQFKSFYLVFHWAEADLLDYWSKKHPYPKMDYSNVLWVAAQCYGIADGLSMIHRYESTNSKNYPSKRHEAAPSASAVNMLEVPVSKRPSNPPKQLYGRHGDIKPQNILWFRDPDNENDMGILKITDFGLTEFSANNSKSYKLNHNIATSPSYRPPEIDLEDGVIGRSYDIWTLGCLYLELITWLLGGWNLVKKFKGERMAFDPMWFDTHTDTFFEIVLCKDTNNTVGAMVKPKVTRFILDLHCHSLCTEYIHKFLDLIQTDILLIKSPNPDDKGRTSCLELNHALSLLNERCRTDSHFASKPAPWDRSSKEKEIVDEAVEANVAPVAADILLRKKLRVHSGKTQPRVTRETRKVFRESVS